MTPRQARSKIAVVTTAFGLAVLLVGPGSTFGLGVPVVGDSDSTTSQVTGAVQTVTDTTQQTVSSTVTNVDSAVQTTVQATTQAAAPQPTASTQPAAAPAKQAPTRSSAPAKKRAASVSRPRTTVQRVAATRTEPAKHAGGASSAPVRVSKRMRPSRPRTLSAPAPTTSSSASDSPSSCAVPDLSLLPGGAQLQALIAVLCAATGGVDLPARIGLVHTSEDTPGIAAPGTTKQSSPGTVHARASSNGVHAIGGSAQRPSSPGAAQATHPGAALAAETPSTSGPSRVGGAGHVDVTDLSQGVPVYGATPHASAPAGHHHHAWFSGQAPGSEILLAIIVVNLAILAGIALWRLAVRWIIPRFA